MFKVGDRVRLKKGWTEMIVLHINSNQVHTAYVTEVAHYKDKSFEELMAIGIGKMHHIAKLCHWYDDKLFRLKHSEYSFKILARTSTGKLVVEWQHTLRVECVSPELQFEVVTPYTIKVRSLTDQKTHRRYECHYEVSKDDELEIGDLLKSQSGWIYEITELDTREARPKKKFEGVRLVTEELS